VSWTLLPSLNPGHLPDWARVSKQIQLISNPGYGVHHILWSSVAEMLHNSMFPCIASLSSKSKWVEKIEYLLWQIFATWERTYKGEVSESSVSPVCLSPQTPSSVLKVKSWNFSYRLLIWMPKKLLRGFLKFCLCAEIWGFSMLGYWRHPYPLAHNLATALAVVVVTFVWRLWRFLFLLSLQ